MSGQLLDLSLLPRWRHGLATIAALGAIDFLPGMLLRFSYQRINGLVRFFDDLLYKRRKLLLVAIGLLTVRLDVDGGAHGKKSKGKPLISHRYNHLPLLPSDPGGFDGSWSYETCLRGQM